MSFTVVFFETLSAWPFFTTSSPSLVSFFTFSAPLDARNDVREYRKCYYVVLSSNMQDFKVVGLQRETILIVSNHISCLWILFKCIQHLAINWRWHTVKIKYAWNLILRNMSLFLISFYLTCKPQRTQFHTLLIIDEKKVACFLRYYTLVKYCFFWVMPMTLL